jgi:hypothetical protein
MFKFKAKSDRRCVALTVKEKWGLTLRVKLVLLVALLMLTLTTSTKAQTGQGAITGKVTDSKGAVIQNASVQVTNNETQVSLTTATNSEGIYNVQSLNPANYTVTVTSKGFEKEIVNNVAIGAAQQPEIDVVLKIGEETAQITVTAQNALLSGTSDVATTVDHQIVENLPYPERSSLEAALLVPGVNGDPSVPGGVMSENPVITTGPVVPGASIAIGGAPPGTSSILVDGSDITQASYARAGISLSGKNVQETTVVTSGLSAKYGRTGAGVIVQVSRPGTNQYHGAITWRHTDPFFNAYPLGGTAPNDDHENFYGFYLGGPVWIPKIYNGHQKTFFYVAVEPARLSNTQGGRGTYPTDDELAGRLHNTLVLLNQTILKSQGYAAAIAAPRVGGVNYQSTVNAQGFPDGPYNAALIQEVMGPSGPDDVSTQLASNPFAQFVLSLAPSPSHPGPYIKYDNPQGTYETDGTNASYLRGVSDIDNRYSFRVDQKINNSNQIYVRYTVTPLAGPRFLALTSDNPLNQVPTDTIVSRDVALGYTHVLSNTVVNNFHYSFLRVNQERNPPASALKEDYAAKYGLTPATVGKGFPTLGSVVEGLQIANDHPQANIDQNFIAGDDLTWAHGNHLIQFGADIRWIQSNQYDNSNSYGGTYSFGTGQTNNGSAGGVSLGTFILGTISTYTAAPVSVPGYYRWRYVAGYFQDDWRASPKLTLNLGLRYEVEVPRVEKFNNQAFLRTNSPGTLNGLPTTASFCFSGACGTGRSIWPTNWYGLEPRIGFAYAATERTTVRASYGIMRLPLSGYENTPDPDFNVASQSVGQQTGGVTANSTVNYITNPVGPLTSSYTALNGNRGPILSSTGLAPVYVSQSNAVPYTQSYSMTVQYQPATKTLVQLSYQGLKGTHLVGGTTGSGFSGSLNVPSVSTLVSAVQNHLNLGASSPNPYSITQNGKVVTETNLQLLNPYQNFFNQPITQIYPRVGTSEYNAFYASINQRYGDGLSLLAYYSWSKSMDNVADTNAGNSGDFGSAPPQNPFDLTDDWAVSSYDQPSRLKVGYVYRLPFGKGMLIDAHHSWINQIVGNISTSGIATVESGFPTYVLLGNTGYFTSFTPNGTNGCVAAKGSNYCSASALPAGYTLRPNIVPGVPLINKNWKVNAFQSNYTPYLNPAAFTTPGSLNNPALGNAPRTLTDARSPRETMFDAQVSKGFSFRERYQLKLTGSFNNAFNHPVYFPGSHTSLYGGVTSSNVTGTLTTNTGAANFDTLNPSAISRIIRVGAEFDF